MLSAPYITLPTVIAGAAVIFLFALALYPSSLLQWFKRKRYQYEVTFSLYMLSPTEKFIFNSILFLFLSMVSIAVALYLPRHVKIIAHRAYYYVSGDLLKNGTTSGVLDTTGAGFLTPTAVAEVAGSA
ncbi:hypothetical protein E4T42_02892 [Aureobasidium subglaciale]|uniref:Uncharacterized protein n=1 Tax=Aureobasidium subglaciale (strain EXF-2481) TaxID=1043005 RepID=A0A074YSU7_AURSE|nr:uncharacterized protein AUEXF2481DRAFT_2020 [Aureobasidium subglaciale EXF-2481]KAI5207559.1 hypothetical protein E4T38_03276 [Aureobasidium subglaciale]KAI5226496.1 hypothetical protein E4T40_03050 [Aureobasidium subglaciale]KAI5229936.1 hypothetical protein E4T41_03273 [Aureobasidium subglaciale]KAI5253449.1 hypothetical protein E4T42_02892 [Aureobasidium subglaciale]KAI5264485.1 hypothetical protein E4T46_03051 [Aureobasidium subglaciale]